MCDWSSNTLRSERAGTDDVRCILDRISLGFPQSGLYITTFACFLAACLLLFVLIIRSPANVPKRLPLLHARHQTS